MEAMEEATAEARGEVRAETTEEATAGAIGEARRQAMGEATAKATGEATVGGHRGGYNRGHGGGHSRGHRKGTAEAIATLGFKGQVRGFQACGVWSCKRPCQQHCGGSTSRAAAGREGTRSALSWPGGTPHWLCLLGSQKQAGLQLMLATEVRAWDPERGGEPLKGQTSPPTNRGLALHVPESPAALSAQASGSLRAAAGGVRGC